jgi:hypothetical protein
MGIRNSSRVNRVRNFAITFIISGFLIMYAGIFLRHHPIIMTICIIFGAILIAISTLIYSLIGMLAIKSIPVICPSCGKKTKMLGKVDLCTHCNEPLTIKQELEGMEYDEAYNYKPTDTKSL